MYFPCWNKQAKLSSTPSLSFSVCIYIDPHPHPHPHTFTKPTTLLLSYSLVLLSLSFLTTVSCKTVSRVFTFHHFLFHNSTTISHCSYNSSRWQRVRNSSMIPMVRASHFLFSSISVLCSNS